MDEQIKAMWAKVVQKMKDIWNKNKLLILIVVPLILLAKFRDILISLIVASGKRLMEKTKQQDGKLKQEQDDANNKANQIVDDANKKSENKPPVDDDWYKK
jgi:hypothetical protein